MGYGIFKIQNPIWDSGMGFPMEEPLAAILWKGHRTKTKSELRPTKLAKKLVEEED